MTCRLPLGIDTHLRCDTNGFDGRTVGIACLVEDGALGGAVGGRGDDDIAKAREVGRALRELLEEVGAGDQPLLLPELDSPRGSRLGATKSIGAEFVARQPPAFGRVLVAVRAQSERRILAQLHPPNRTQPNAIKDFSSTVAIDFPHLVHDTGAVRHACKPDFDAVG